MRRYRDDMQNMGKAIRERFKASGLSMLAVAQQAGLPYAVVHGMLTGGGGNPKLASVQRVCEVVGLELRPVRGKRKAEVLR